MLRRPLYVDGNLEQSEASFNVGEEEVNNSDSEVEEGQLEPTFEETISDSEDEDNGAVNINGEGEELQFFETISKRGRSLLNRGGFEFYYQRRYDDGDEAWRCNYRGSRGTKYCPVKIKVH